MDLQQKVIMYSLISAGLGIIYGAYLIFWILKKSEGTDKMREIARAIQEGASAFLKRQYQAVALVAAIIFVLLAIFLGWRTGVGFLIGAICSASAGIIGMLISVRTNVRVANIASKGVHPALSLAFRGGTVTGILTGSLGLLAIVITWLLFKDIQFLIALGFGGSLISIFARLGGGIYTKGADVGADLVGKIEAGIPEDDPRNPAVIADNVGDNVGDCAGMAADVFETYVVTIVAAMILIQLILNNALYFLFPIVLGGVGIISSILASLWLRKTKKIMNSLYFSFAISAIFALLGFFLINHFYIHNLNWFWANLIGIAVVVALFIITEFYTGAGFSPVKNLARSSETGPGTTMISGIALSMKSTVLPVLVIVGAIWASWYFAGIIGIAMAVASMLSLAPIIVSIDSYGPITDNAGGIAEMSGLSENIRKTTDALDAVGNTTKAVTKAYAIGSAGLAALVLFSAYTEEIIKSGKFTTIFQIAEPKVLIGIFVGILIVYLFAALAMEAVGKAAYSIVVEVRRQFKEMRGILQGKVKPKYGRAVDIVTKAALKQMIVPSLLPVVIPIITAWIFGTQALAGILIGSIAGGLFVALMMTTGGAAWDNAKKYIESGQLGGKGSETHKAAIVGDTVGDAYKDTAGPAINPVIKVINIVALLIIRIL